MFSTEIVLMGLALAIDASVVSFALGLMIPHLSVPTKFAKGGIIVSVFGFFQFLMLWLGSLGGEFISFSQYGHLFHFLVAAIFLSIGVKFFIESFQEKIFPIAWGAWPLLSLGVLTSLDALGAGVSLGTLPRTYIIALEVGVITGLLCGVFFGLSHYIKSIPDRWLIRGASLIFSGLGLSVFWRYL